MAQAPSFPRTPTLAERYWQDPAEDVLCGRYVGPTAVYPADVDSGEYPIHAQAERAQYWLGERALLTGDVTLKQGNRILHAETADVDLRTHQATLPEGVEIADIDVVMSGEWASANLGSREVELEQTQFVLLPPQMRGKAQRLTQDERGDLTMRRSFFTRCEPGNNAWQMAASKIDVARGDVFATARNAVLRVKGVPVFYTPYIRFPVTDDRQSGWLFPSLGYSDEDGLDLALPYYLNLAPNYDATFTPRYFSDRGAMGELELRHLSGWQHSTLGGALLPEDDLYDGTFDREDFEALFPGEPFDPADRWLYSFNHEGRLGDIRSLIDYAAVSDRDYFRDLGTDLALSSRIQLERRGELQYSRGGLFARVWAQRFQRLDEIRADPYERLPELELLYNGEILGPLDGSVGAALSRFDRTAGQVGLEGVTGERLHVEPRLRLPLNFPFGFLNFTTGYRYTRYDLDDNGVTGLTASFDETPDRSIGLGSVGAGLFFERDLNLFGRAMLQTLEPELFYLYQESDDQADLPRFDASALTFGYNQLFRDNRFAGLDRIGDANQLATGITSRLINNSNGREYFRASIGEIHYFEDREVTLIGSPVADDRHTTSALVAALSATPSRRVRIALSVIWDPHDNEIDEAGAGLQYRYDNRKMFSVGYRNRRIENIEQTDVSAYWPLTTRLSLMARWNYDLVSGRTIEGFGGIEYNDCCWQVRLIARRFLESPGNRLFANVEADEGIFFQIVFKGLAGLGSQVESVLERGIRGYRSEATRG